MLFPQLLTQLIPLRSLLKVSSEGFPDWLYCYSSIPNLPALLSFTILESQAVTRHGFFVHLLTVCLYCQQRGSSRAWPKLLPSLVHLAL